MKIRLTTKGKKVLITSLLLTGFVFITAAMVVVEDLTSSIITSEEPTTSYIELETEDYLIEEYVEVDVEETVDNIIEYEEYEYLDNEYPTKTLIEELLANFEVTPWSEIRNIIPYTGTWHENYEDIDEDSKFYMYDVKTGTILQFYNFGISNAHMDIAPTTEEQANKFHEMVDGEYSWNSRIVIIIHNGKAHLASINTQIHGGGPSFFRAAQFTRFRGGSTRAGQPGHICLHFLGSRNSQRQHQRGIIYFVENMPEEGFIFIVIYSPFQFQQETDEVLGIDYPKLQLIHYYHENFN